MRRPPSPSGYVEVCYDDSEKCVVQIKTKLNIIPSMHIENRNHKESKGPYLSITRNAFGWCIYLNGDILEISAPIPDPKYLHTTEETPIFYSMQ